MSSAVERALFAHLWKETQKELARASGHPRRLRGTVAYCLKIGGVDAGEHRWNDGAPTIRLYRRWDLPADLEEPDLLTRPSEDACVLAHERGHFVSDPTGNRAQSAYSTWRQGAPLTAAQKAVILEDERRAWQHARTYLTLLGWEDWVTFEAIRWRLLGGYSEGLTSHTAR